jgi:hypothetical protein
VEEARGRTRCDLRTHEGGRASRTMRLERRHQPPGGRLVGERGPRRSKPERPATTLRTARRRGHDRRSAAPAARIAERHEACPALRAHGTAGELGLAAAGAERRNDKREQPFEKRLCHGPTLPRKSMPLTTRLQEFGDE